MFDARKAKLLPAGKALAIRGCPGLRLEATQSTRTWVYRYRLNPKLLRQTRLGRWPVMSIAQAMTEWAKLRDQRRDGHDVGAERRAAKAAEKARVADERTSGCYTGFVSLGWVNLSKYCELSGETHDAVEKRLRTGKWLRGIHARQPDGSAELWVNLRAVEDWAEGKKPPHRHGDGK